MKKILLILILVISTFLITSAQNTVAVDIYSAGVSGGTHVVTVKYCANGDFQSSDNSDEWQGQVITLGWTPATGIVSSGGVGSGQITNFSSSSLPFVGMFNNSSSAIIAYDLAEIGGASDGNIYTGFVTTTTQDGVSIPDGTCVDVFSFEVPESTCMASDCVFLKEDNTGAGSFQLGADIKNSAFTGNRWDGVSSSAPLPISLYKFYASKESNSSASLTWTTSSEINSSHFEIERSINGINWNQLGSVGAAGNSNFEKDYRYLDNGIDIIGTSRFYYRLKMVDLDGKYEYSLIRSVDFNKEQKGEARFTIYPNPSTDYINIQLIDIDESTQAILVIRDITGKMVSSNEIDILKEYKLDVSSFAVGLYNASITVGGEKLTNKKFLVQK